MTTKIHRAQVQNAGITHNLFGRRLTKLVVQLLDAGKCDVGLVYAWACDAADNHFTYSQAESHWISVLLMKFSSSLRHAKMPHCKCFETNVQIWDGVGFFG